MAAVLQHDANTPIPVEDRSRAGPAVEADRLDAWPFGGGPPMSGAAPSREVAYRVFATEFEEATFSYAESDDDRAPQYLVTPTGARVNRLFVAGVLTETEEVSDGVLRARIVDPTGAFVLYAGQYQPDALAFFERAEPPAFVALTGKARTFEPEDSDQIFTSLRPEQVNEVDPATRDSWVVETAQQTLARAGLLAQALELEERGDELRARLGEAGVEPGLAAGIPHAIEEYEPTTGYLAALQEVALEAVQVMAGEIDEVSASAGAPDQSGSGEVLTGFSAVTLAPGVPDDPIETDVGDSGSIDEQPTASQPEDPASESVEKAAETESEESDAETESDVIDSGTESDDIDAETEPDQTVAEPESAEEDEAPDEPDPAKEEKSEPTEEAVATPDSESPEETEPASQEPADGKESAEEGEDEFYELSEEERAEVEENYDVGFESGSEIGSPEETPDIEPEADVPEEPAEPDDSEEQTETETDQETADEGEEAEKSGEEAEEPEDSSDETSSITEGELQNIVVDTLKELGDGEGVPRDELIDTVQENHDVDEPAIEDAIEAALLGGRCFESGAEDLKPI